MTERPSPLWNIDQKAFAENLAAKDAANILARFSHLKKIGLAILTPDLKLLHCNQFWIKLVSGSDRTEATQKEGQPSLYALMPEAKSFLAPLISRALAGEFVHEQAVRLSLENRIVYWDISYFPQQSNKEITGLVSLIEDKTKDVVTRKRLSKRAADQREKLSALYDVMSATAEAPDLRTTLAWSLERIVAAVKCPAGALQLIDNFDPQADVTSLRLIAHQGLSEEFVANLQTVPVQDSLAGITLNQDKPIVIPDLLAHGLIPIGPNENKNLHSYVGVGMHVRDRTVGVLSVFAPKDRTFGEVELALLDSVADQIAVVVENAYLYKQAEELAVIEERNRLARELHDSVTQAIYSLTLFAEAGLRLIKSGNRQLVEDCLNRLNETSQQALKEMRLLLHKLRPPDLEEEGLAGALQQRLDEVEARANVEAQLLLEGNIDDLPDAVEEQLYRIAQEALNNALKHSSASILTVKIRADEDTIELEVYDDGQGFDLEEAEDSGGMGLRNIEERVETMDGDFSITSAPGEGTSVKVSVDIDELEEIEEDDLF